MVDSTQSAKECEERQALRMSVWVGTRLLRKMCEKTKQERSTRHHETAYRARAACHTRRMGRCQRGGLKSSVNYGVLERRFRRRP